MIGHNIVIEKGLANKILNCIRNDYVYITRVGLGLWDLCAGHCLLKEVGGNITNFKGEEIAYGEDLFIYFECFVYSSEEKKNVLELFT